MKRVLIIGGGFGGCSSAHLLALQGGWDVTIIESTALLGAGVRTNYWGGHTYTFGPRHFLTQNEKVYQYLHEYCPLRRCQEHEFLTYVERDGAFYSYPIHMDDVARMPDKEAIYDQLRNRSGVENAQNLEEFWVGSVGPILFDKIVNTYTKKMWKLKSCKELDTFKWSPKGVTIKDGPRACWDTAISAFPHAPNGYNDYFDLSTAAAKILFSTTIERYDIPKKRVYFKGEWHSYDVIVNTISPDIIFDYAYGELPYIGRDFHKIVLPIEHCFPENVYFLYYPNGEAFTRLVEYKKFYRHTSPTTLIGMEVPSLSGKYYPMPLKSEQARAQKYFDLMPDGVFSLGRAGSYRYDVDIDDAIEQAMAMVEKLK